MLLNCIGLFHSGSERAKLSALGAFRELVILANREKLLAPSPPNNIPDDAPSDEAWKKWIIDEMRKRTGYCIWVCVNRSKHIIKHTLTPS